MQAARILLLISFIFINYPIILYADQPTNTITVSCNEKGSSVNSYVFGNNLLGFDPTTYENRAKEYYGYSNYGAGIWDGKWNKPVPETISLLKDIHTSVVRFPGGCGSHHYDWKKAIGDNRKVFWYGLDEFLKTARLIGAEPIYTVSYFTGTERDAADLVEYLNAVDDGKHPWAARRAKNGHKEPYGVKYFEIGNEIYHGDHKTIIRVDGPEYARNYLKYYEAMKAIDPLIKIGVVLTNDEWDKQVASAIGYRVDFGIIHVYPSPAVGKALERLSAKEIFIASLAQPQLEYQPFFQRTLSIFRKYAGKDIPLAITEFNGGYTQKRPVPYRYTLGCSMVNAELLRTFMNPQNDILMANYWDALSEPWGMVNNHFDGTYQTLRGSYFKRPNYYIFEMYAKHFGEVLLEPKVVSEGYESPSHRFVGGTPEGRVIGGNLLSGEWVTVPQAGVEVKRQNDILEVIFTSPIKFNYYHSSQEAMVAPGQDYRFSGYIRTEDLESSAGICLTVQDARGWDRTHFAVSSQALTGTVDWTYVEGVFQTLNDTQSVKVMVRHTSNIGPLKGKVFLKDAKLEKFIFQGNTLVPYLSVNASKSADGKKMYLMVINKNMDTSITATVDLKDFAPASKGNAWVLNGPSVEATNEKDHDTVKVMQHEFEIKNNPFEFTFEPHSVTAIEIQRYVSTE